MSERGVSVSPYRSFAAQSRHYFAREHRWVPSKPLHSPAAWRGSDMRAEWDSADASWCYKLSDDDRAEIYAAVAQAPEELALINRENFVLPNLSAVIGQWRSQLATGTGVQIIKGLPTHEPMQWVRRAYWGLGHHLGEPGAQNPQQELLGEVRDYREDDPNVRLYRTPHNINLHCDAADVVGLLCLQTAVRGGHSRIVSTVTLFNELLAEHPDLISALFDRFKLDSRGERSEGTLPYSEPVPCCFDGEMLRTFYHSDYMRSVSRHAGVAVSSEQQQILDFYDSRGADPDLYFDMWLEPGDIQLLSNHTVAHARTAYQDSAEQQRHLLRLWLSLSPSNR